MKDRSESNDRQWVPPKSSLSKPPQPVAASQRGHQPKWQLYLLAALTTLAMLGVRFAVTAWLGNRQALILFLLPIILSAYLGGLGPGLLATSVAAFTTLNFFLPPRNPILTGNPVDLALWFVMIAAGVLVSALSEGLLRARRRAEASERLQTVTLASIGDAVITTNLQGNLTFLNTEAERLTGWPLAEALGQPLHTVFRVLDAPPLQFIENLVETVIRAGTTVNFAKQLRLLARDGREIPIETNSAPIKLTDEAVLGIVLIFRDNTERNRAAEELRESEQHFRALFEGAGVGNVECEANSGQFLQVNQKMSEITGYTTEELCGLTFAEITYPADLTSTLAEYHRFIAQQVSSYAVEKRYVRKDGTLAWVSVTSSLLLDEAGQPWRTVAAIQDITERKRAEAALQLSEERLRLLHHITSNPQTNHAEKLNQLLALGCRQFEVENGVLGRLDHTQYQVSHAVSQTNTVTAGWSCPSHQTYCQETVRLNDLLAFEHAGATEWREHQAYATYGVETYFGVPVQCAEQIYGTLCFTSTTPRAVPFTSGDREFLRLMAQWIGAELTRQATAESLRESEARFHALFEQTAVGSVIVDLETQRVVDCNQVAAEMLGYTRAEFLTLSVAEIEALHGPAEIAQGKAVLAHTKKVQFETVYRKKTGELRDVMVVATNIQIQGRDYGYGSIVDITEKKQAEADLQQERERLENIAAASPIVICSFRVSPARKHAYPYVSPAFYDLYGITPQDLMDDPRITDQRVHPDDLPALVNTLLLSARALSRWHHTWRVKHPDKGEIWVEGYATPLREADGSTIWHGILNEVTERVRAENALRFEKERLEKMAMASPLGMYSFQLSQGKFSLPFASAAFYEIYGVTADELAQNSAAITSRIHAKDLVCIRESMAAAATTLSLMDVMYRYQHPDKGERWLESFTAPILESDGSMTWHGLTNDITDRKQAEQALLLTQNQLRHLATHLQTVREEERTAIAREIHDDLGQMLTAMRFNLKWIEQALEPDAADMRQRVANAIDLIGQTIQVVRRLATSLHPSILDDFGLPAALEWQITEFQKHSGIRCRIEALPQSVTLERNRALALFRICQETLTNVARHAAATEIRLSLQEEQENIWLRIHDNGCGIAVDALAKRRSLGLISMRERALSLGGEFSVQGSPGQGTTVTVRIPLPNVLEPALS